MTPGGNLWRNHLTFTVARGTIDHRCYPHIIREILLHADAQLLLRFRLTSTAYADDCLRMLTHHVIVSSTMWHLEVNSVRGNWPRIYGYRGLLQPFQANPWIFRHSRIVDIDSASYSHTSELVRSALKNLETLRILPGVKCAETGSYRLDLIHLSPGSVVVFGDLPDFDHGFYVWAGTTLPACRRVVWTVSHVIPLVPRSAGNYIFYSPYRVETAVLHFRFCQPTEEADTMFSRLARIIGYIARMGPCTRVVVVDLDKMPESGATHLGDLFQERQDRLVDILVATLGDRAGRVTFMTGRQYCSVHGAEQYRIETCDKLW